MAASASGAGGRLSRQGRPRPAFPAQR
jgi:hypothetical protein